MNGNGRPLRLLDHHRENLRQSGMSDETITTSGIYSEVDRHAISALLNRKRPWSQKHGPVLVFPFFDQQGNTTLHRIRPDRPFKRGGKEAKYLQPSRRPVQPYFPPAIHEQLADKSIRVIITEGEKKSLAATQEGFPTIGIVGVDNWHPKGAITLLPQLERIGWKGRDVLIAFDSDAIDNPNVKRNEVLLGSALASRGANVRVVRIPPATNGEKQGLDDFLVANGASELHRLINEAEPPDESTEPTGGVRSTTSNT